MLRRTLIAGGGAAAAGLSVRAEVARPAAGPMIFVSPLGDDNAPGDADHPLRTLEAARDAARRQRSRQRGTRIAIQLAAGEHRLARPLVLDLRDANVAWTSAPGAEPIVTSDMVVAGWEPISTPPEAPPQAQGRIWSAPLPAGVAPPNVLFDDLGLAPRARTTAFTHARRSLGYTGADAAHRILVVEEAERLSRSLAPGLEAAQVDVVGAAPWTMNYLDIASVDGGRIRLKAPASYVMAAPLHYLPAGAVHIENTFAGLTEPGRWLADPVARRLYLWPRGSSPRNIRTPTLVELVRVEGVLDVPGHRDRPVRGISFEGIRFRHGLRYEHSGRTGLGLQHDWERYDSPTALVRFRGAEDCAVRRCAFGPSGGTGLRLDLHARRIEVSHNDFADLGGCGVLLAGYGPGLKDVNRGNIVRANKVERIGRLWRHAIGVWAWQSGENLIAENRIAHLPYTGIASTGRISLDRSGLGEASRTVRWREVGDATDRDSWAIRERFLHSRRNQIVENDISHVLEAVNDGNGIYVSGAGAGNLVARNRVHDTPSRLAGEAIRCDDDQHDVIVRGNVVARFGGSGVGICSKGRNDILENIVAWPAGPVLRGMISLEPAGNSSHAGSHIARNILVGDAREQPLVFRQTLDVETKGGAGGIAMDHNLYFNAADPGAAKEHLSWARAHGWDLNSVIEDPQIEDGEAGSLRFRPTSPVHRLGGPRSAGVHGND